MNEDDKRSWKNRHWGGKHCKKCIRYSPSWLSQVCAYTNQPLGLTDLEREKKYVIN